MNRTRWIIVAVVILGVVAGAAWLKGRGHKAAARYRTAAVERGDITSTVSATGNVQPVLQVQVGSQVSGTLSKLYVDFNSHVKAGQVLAQLETSAFRARQAQAEASVAHAQASLHNGQLGLKRAIELQKGDFVAQSDVDAAQATVDQQKADLKQAQAALEAAQVDLDHTTILSPIDGVVISRSIDVGQTVAASLQAPQLFLIGNDLRRMQVQTNIDEADIGRIRPGQRADFTVDAYPDARFTGTVVQVRLVPQVSSNVVTYQTLISARNDDLRLRPGMTANVTILLDTHTDVLKVANSALRFKPPGWTGGRPGGGGPGGMPGGGMRRGFAALWGRIVPAALAQAPPAGGPGHWPGANDPYVKEVRARVEKGELTREEARDLIRKHFAELAAAGGAPGAGGHAGSGATAPGIRAGAADPHAPAASGAGVQRGGGTRTRAAMSTFGGRELGRYENVLAVGGPAEVVFKPGSVFLLQDGKPVRVRVMTGISDGTFTEVRSDSLKAGDLVVTGMDSPAAGNPALTPPPGMGGPQFRGPGGGGRR